MHKVKYNYVIIPVITFLSTGFAKYFNYTGMAWFKTLILPDFAPPPWLIEITWHGIIALTTIAALVVWNTFQHTKYFIFMMSMFLFNALFFILMNFLIFNKHNLYGALIIEALMALTIACLLMLLWNKSKLAITLLAPYEVWIIFIIYFHYNIWQLNIKTLV